MIRTVRNHAFWMPLIAIALVLSFVVHDAQLKHDHPFAPHTHSHEHSEGQQHEQNSDAFVSVYTHSDRKDFPALLLLIATVPALLLVSNTLPRAPGVPTQRTQNVQSYDYHRLLFRRGILNSKRY